MQDRNSAEYRRWRQEVKERDEYICRQCGADTNLEVHHIKPYDKYRVLATDTDNGITLCRNCHARLKGKEESTNLLTIIEEITGQHDSQTADQLKRLNSKFCNYLVRLLESGKSDTRNNIVDQLDIQLSAYPDSLNQFLSLIRYRLDKENGSDRGFAGQMATEFLMRYYKGEEVIKNDSEAAEWFHEAAQQGRAIMQTCLGWMYHHGLMVEQNDEEAVKWFQKAAQQKCDIAQYSLGCMYETGRGIEQNDEEAVKWFQRAAQQECDIAQYSLGCMYVEGRGVEQNNKEAIKWFQKAAHQGYADAQYILGVVYTWGLDVEQDHEEAAKWFYKAAQQGDTTAQTHLGLMYADGKGVERDHKEAIKWYRKAAQQDFAIAQYILGVVYTKGLDVEQDYEEAAKWFQKAAEQGHAEAQDNLRRYRTETSTID